VLTAAVILLTAAAICGVFVFTSHSSSRGTARESAQSQSAYARAHGGAAPAQEDSAPDPGPSETSPDPSTGSDGVRIGTAASKDPSSSSVAAFLGQYFAAIDTHNYQSFVSLLSSKLQQEETQEAFDKGYRSTVDSNEMLMGISTSSDGDMDAKVTFTSHQDPADSPDQSESCTVWNISMFLVQGSSSGYLVDPAPSDYHASYKPCS
jgi:hypothetical protein